ncbi:formate dehydrogenase cytochrome b556 subunit, partial [Pseudomonas aeruginosa]
MSLRAGVAAGPPRPGGSGGALEESEMKNEIQRYNANERSNHWAVAILFFMAG